MFRISIRLAVVSGVAALSCSVNGLDDTRGTGGRDSGTKDGASDAPSGHGGIGSGGWPDSGSGTGGAKGGGSGGGSGGSTGGATGGGTGGDTGGGTGGTSCNT